MTERVLCCVGLVLALVAIYVDAAGLAGWMGP
jgi:hypothetical protein